MHWLLHVLGIDTQQSDFYDFWSGVGTQIALIIGIASALRHKNCHVKGCKAFIRTAKDPKHGWYACSKHHTLKHYYGVNPHV